MGKNKVKKRLTIKKQFVTYYILVLILSLITTFFVTVAFYSIYHHFYGNKNIKINDKKILSIIEYSQKYYDSIFEPGYKSKFDNLVHKNNMEYYIKDMNDKILITSTRKHSNTHSSLVWDIWTDILNNSLGTSSISVPLSDHGKGQVDRVLILLKYDDLWLILLIFVDIGIPFTCFVLFTLLFAGRISHRIKSPLNELMSAVEKIKKKDLDFSMDYTQNNEIGDLASAFEGMRKELKSSLIREWQLEQDRRDMVTSITHDIKTPLAIIHGHVEVLQDGLLNDKEKLKSYLITIEQNINRAKKLIDEMNGLVEIESTDFFLELQEIDLEAFVNKKITELRLLSERKEISMLSAVTDSRKLKIPVPVDKDRLEQVIDNVIGNSIRFTQKGGSISITVQISDGKAHFRICDTGPGFHGKDFESLFKKFYKGDTSRSREKGHSGLGLYIAKTLVNMHGGEINASNNEGKGACIEFFITF